MSGRNTAILRNERALLDTAPVEKATFFKDGGALAFKGVIHCTKIAGFTEEAFASLAPGATLQSIFDAAAITDMSCR